MRSNITTTNATGTIGHCFNWVQFYIVGVTLSPYFIKRMEGDVTFLNMCLMGLIIGALYWAAVTISFIIISLLINLIIWICNGEILKSWDTDDDWVLISTIVQRLNYVFYLIFGKKQDNYKKSNIHKKPKNKKEVPVINDPDFITATREIDNWLNDKKLEKQFDKVTMDGGRG